MTKAFVILLGQRGLHNLFLQVEHPDHPPLSANVWISPGALPKARRIVLPESKTLEIRARRIGEQGLLRDLYPLIRSRATDCPTDWSEADGVLTIRRIDLISDKATRLLRIIHAPEQGPVLFSDVIDLKQHEGDPISIDVTMKPSVRVEGRLADQVPRPVQGGSPQHVWFGFEEPELHPCQIPAAPVYKRGKDDVPP